MKTDTKTTILLAFLIHRTTMQQMKLKDLYIACKHYMEEGYGEKTLVVSGDNEGNHYHGMFYTLTPITAENKDGFQDLIYDNNEMNLENIIVVG